MKNKRTSRAAFTILGCCLLVVAFTTGCSWSVDGPGVRIQSPPPEDSLDETTN